MTATSILISKKLSAKLLGISTGLFDKLRRQGRIEGVPIGKRVMFRREDVEALALTPSQRKALTRECMGSVQ
jgi:excisionase family DNA binding protein